jgi:hypothetical protein
MRQSILLGVMGQLKGDVIQSQSTARQFASKAYHTRSKASPALELYYSILQHVVLAKSIGAHPLAALPGALSATTHSCLGNILVYHIGILLFADVDLMEKN